MGMPVKINIVDKKATEEDIAEIFSYFHFIDSKFSTYKNNSEITRINTGHINQANYSDDMKTVLKLSELTKSETYGYFDIQINDHIDPSGLVKGYAIWEAAKKLLGKGFENFFVEIGGDIQTQGHNEKGEKWKVGIRNPFNTNEIIKEVGLDHEGIATSGTYLRGDHIVNPKAQKPATEIASITVIGPNIYDADRFATAAFAMGERGIGFIDTLSGFEGYMITNKKQALFTRGFEKYVIKN